MELTAGVAENRDLAAGSIIYDWGRSPDLSYSQNLSQQRAFQTRRTSHLIQVQTITVCGVHGK